MDFVTSPSQLSPPPHLGPASQKEERAGLLPSHNISEQTASPPTAYRPPAVKHVSAPTYNSPLRHHLRGQSAPRHVKESLDARSEYVTSQDDGTAQHRINQYIIKQEIGRGSFGAVHLAVDQYGTEYAVKEFSKSRLRKRAQSHILRKPRGQPKQGHLGEASFNSPLHRNPEGRPGGEHGRNSIELIKEEIAIMKKLNHPNLCGLIEVLDDPREDSLYMVMEMCKKGIIMKVGLDQRADPYDDESCRCWFRDLILGIEYLHAQGIVHRDIKPDNCLLTQDDVLKVVDFGVSEMFEKHSEMLTAKSAGSPAFLPPELCVVKHGDISGKSADIWSMGVTLYCLKYGHIPFEKSGIFELYEAIKNEEPMSEAERDQDFADLMHKILEKDATRRIKMVELRDHRWVTKRGTDPLLSEEENIAELIGPPTAAEMETAITGNVANLMTVMKAVNKFKKLLANKRPPVMSSILGDEGSSRFFQPPLRMNKDAKVAALPLKSHSVTAFDRSTVEQALAVEGIHRGTDSFQSPDRIQPGQINTAHPLAPRGEAPLKAISSPTLSRDSDPIQEVQSQLARISTGRQDEEQDPYLAFRPTHPPGSGHARSYDEVRRRGQAHDPLEDHLYLYIGPSTFSGNSNNADRRATFAPTGEDNDALFVSESPGAADIDIYETAYRDEIERIRKRVEEEGKDGEEPTVYLTRRVDDRLLAVGQFAGRFMAKGEHGLEKFGNVTRWRDRKARVSDVSRALRAAATEEYEKRRQERRQKDREAAAQMQTPKEKAGSDSSSEAQLVSQQQDASPGPLPEGYLTQSRSSSMFMQAALAGKAAEKGRQAKQSFRSFMGKRREKGSGSKDSDDAT